MIGDFKVDSVCWDEDGDSIMIAAGTPISEIVDNGEDFEFEYDGGWYSCEDRLSESVTLESSGSKDKEVEQSKDYIPCPNMTPLSRKYLLL